MNETKDCLLGKDMVLAMCSIKLPNEGRLTPSLSGG